MLFSKLLVAAATLAVASAKVALTNSVFAGIANNVPFTITWSGQNGAVTLKLNSGPALAQVFVTTIATGQTGQSFVWTPQNLPTGMYIIEIDDSTDVNYSIPFSLAGVAVTSSSTPSGTPSASTASGTPSASTPSGTLSASTLSTVSFTSTVFTTSAPASSSVTGSPASSSTAAATKIATSSNGSTNGTASKTTSSTSSPTPGSASRYGSPLALVLAAFIAFFLLS